MFDSSIIEAAKAHALAAFPQEAVGFVVDGAYCPQANAAADPQNAFAVSDAAYLAVAGKLQAVVHSHVNGLAYPSLADMRQQQASAVPWGIVVTDGNRAADPFWWGEGAPVAPLVGRAFRHGVTDCYALIRDFYRIERGVVLPDYPRSWDWWAGDDGDLYRQHFAAAGFERISAADAQPGDVFLAQIRSKVPNHGGIYLGNGLMLHHKAGRDGFDPSRLSCREPIARWQDFVTHWLRYRGCA